MKIWLCNNLIWLVKLQIIVDKTHRNTTHVKSIFHASKKPFDFVHIYKNLYDKVRDGKSLQNSTGKTSSPENEHTKYVEKMLKIMQKKQKCQKLHKKGKHLLKTPWTKQKLSQLWKISTLGAAAAATFFHLRIKY